MTCPQCRAQNPEDARFCEECGARLALACPQCGAEVSPGKKFCRSCGTALSGWTPSPPLSPASYTPRHLAEKILTSKSALEGERKQVTVLFADLKGSMELLADRDPEEARKLLDPVLERMMDAVHRYEGTVNQVMGDGIMALFGAPVAHEDHAVRACYAAHDMQAAMRRYTAEVRHAHGIDMQIRVGLNSGEVVVRAIGSDLRMDYTAVGQTTHLAARMEQLAPPGTIRLTADTLRLAEGYLEVKPLGPVPVKGLETPVDVYEMVGTGPRRSRLHTAAARGLTRFVGRETELEALRQALARSAAGHGQVVAIVGEPGVGKSRLVWEVTHSHRVHGWLVLHAGSVSYGKATSYLPVIDLLKGYFAIEDRDGPRAAQEKVIGKLLTLDRALEPSLPAFLALLDVPTDDPQWATLDPPQRRRRTLDALKRLLLRESQRQPLLVVFEDLHWIDSETQALLEGLVESLPAARMLLLVNYRPEYQHAWGSRTYYTQIRLDPLPPESSEDLLDALLGRDASLDPLKRVLIARTEGNPFFLEESVQALVETGALGGERGASRLARPLPMIQVPVTVQAVLAARIDRLASGDKALLQTASVIGKDIPFALLHAVAEQNEDELHAALGRLQAAEFLYETSILPDLEYTFKHALTHDVAYGSLLKDRRRALHGRIVETIERLYSHRLTEHVEQLAHHALRAEAWEQALTYFWQAGTKAMTRSAHREAIASFEHALTALAHLPETRERREQAIDLRFELRYALSPIGEWARALTYLRDALTLAEALDDQGRLAWTLANMAAPLTLEGRHVQAAEASERALTAAAALGDFPLQMEASFYAAFAYGNLGEYHRSLSLLRNAISALVGDWIHWGTPAISSVNCRTYLGVYLARLGEFAEAIQHTEEGIRIAEEASHPYSRISAYLGAGEVNLIRGDVPLAITELSRGVQLVHEWGLPGLRTWGTASLAFANAIAGRTGQALLLADQVAEWIGELPGIAVMSIRLGEAYLALGRPSDATVHANRALTVSRHHGERAHEALALCLMGEITARSDRLDVEVAVGHCRQALNLASELGMRPLVAHCHLGLGKVYGRTGDAAKAQEHRTTAATMYREMGMTFWLGKAKAALTGAQS